MKFAKEIESGVLWGLAGSFGSVVAHAVVRRAGMGNISDTVLTLACSAAFIIAAEKIALPALAHLRKSGNSAECPPVNAAFLFYLFLNPENCDALVGDLEERYRFILKKFGQRRANFWYWAQAIRSVGPIVMAWAKKIVMKPAAAAITWAAAKHWLKDGSWLVMIAEVWKRIRL